MAARLLAALILLVGGCAATTTDPTITKHDFAGTGGNVDLAGADLTGADLTGFGTDDMVIVGDMSRLAWTDRSYSTTSTLWSVWGNGAAVWTVGDGGLLLKSMGAGAFALDAATKPAGTPSLYSISGAGSGPPGNPLFTAGTAGAIWSYSNMPAPSGAWSAVASTGTMNFSAVWLAPDGQAFAVGPGNVAKKSGAPWTDISGLDATAFGLWGVQTGVATYTVYACGAAQNGVGRIWKYTTAGGSFVVETTGIPNVALYGVYGFGENDIYVVGDLGTILHSTGSGAWNAQTLPGGVTTAINAVGGAGPNEVYAVGDNGVVLHKYDASSTTWTKEALANPMENRNFLGVWANSALVVAVGANGAILTK